MLHLSLLKVDTVCCLVWIDCQSSAYRSWLGISTLHARYHAPFPQGVMCCSGRSLYAPPLHQSSSSHFVSAATHSAFSSGSWYEALCCTAKHYWAPLKPVTGPVTCSISFHRPQNALRKQTAIANWKLFLQGIPGPTKANREGPGPGCPRSESH